MIPLKLETLLDGRVVEQDRIEYKKGWNPSDIIHTICAFANDFTNTNGGYIVIGIDEQNGRPILPPEGIDEDELDRVQKEIFQYCNLIEPRYIPHSEVIEYQNKWVIYLWCSAGSNGPYKAPKDVYSDKNKQSKTDKHREYWIKPFSVKTIAKDEELSELFDKFNAVPFDDRVNREVKISDIRRGYVEDFLRESNSSLVEELNNRTLEELLVSMEVANFTDTGIDVRNIGIMMFAEHPEKFMPGAKIELIRFNSVEAEASDDFTEKNFTGPIYKQIRDTLSYIQTNVIEEKVIKVENRAEADRFFNYPYNALEEAIVNAVFHKSYREQEPVEIRVYVDCIRIINYPGPAKWIDMNKFRQGKILARKYRNRRIGEFLKEIDLSEKKSTGISKILRELKKNRSPLPEFETDDERNYLITTIKMHEAFVTSDKVSDKVSDKMSDKMSDKEKIIYEALLNIFEVKNFVTTSDITKKTGVAASTARRYLGKFCDFGIIISDGKNKGTKYYLSKK